MDNRSLLCKIGPKLSTESDCNAVQPQHRTLNFRTVAGHEWCPVLLNHTGQQVPSGSNLIEIVKYRRSNESTKIRMHAGYITLPLPNGTTVWSKTIYSVGMNGFAIHKWSRRHSRTFMMIVSLAQDQRMRKETKNRTLGRDSAGDQILMFCFNLNTAWFYCYCFFCCCCCIVSFH